MGSIEPGTPEPAQPPIRQTHPDSDAIPPFDVLPLSSDEISALRAMARVVLSQNTEAHAQRLIHDLAAQLQKAGVALQHAAGFLKDANKMPQAMAAHQASRQALEQAKGLVD